MDFDEIMHNLKYQQSYAKDNFVPIIRPNSAKFLYDFIKENNIRKVLEIGTAIGYSGSIMLSAGVEELITVDINAEYQKIARKTFEDFKYSDNVTMYCEDAKTLLPKLIQDNQKFDMIFLDGAKGQYIYYLPNLVKLLNRDSIIFADNVLLQGMVESSEKIPHKKRTMVVNLRRYLNRIKDDDFDSELIRIEDGIAISRYLGGKE